MYYREIRVWVPSEEVLDVKFLKHEDFFVYIFLNKPYIVTAKVLGTRNFIGFGIDGNIYLLSRENNREIYVSSALAVFARQLKLYRDFSEQSFENEAEQQNNAQIFAEKIIKLDKNAISSENNFWSKITKQMEFEVIQEVKKW